MEAVMMPTTKGVDAQAAAKKLRDRNAAQVQQQNDASTSAMLDKTAKLRALRLAKEAADALQAPEPKKPTNKKPTKKAVED
jgi:hypothetical protein